MLECLPHTLRRIRYQLPILYSTAGSQLTGNSSYHHLQESTNTRPLRKYFWHAPSKSTQGANHGCQLAIPCQVHMQYQGNTVIWQEIDMSTQNCKIHAESLRSEWCCHDAVMMLAPLPCQSWHPLLPVSKLHPCVASRTSTLSCDIIAPVIFCNIHARPLDYTTPVWKVSDLALAAAFALSFVTTMASASTQMMNDEISRSKYERTTLKRWRVITNWQPSSVSLCFKYNAYVQSEQRFRRIRYQLPILYSTAGSQLTGNSSYHHLQESTNTRPLRKYFWHAPSKSTQGANHGCQLAIPCQVHMQYQGNTVIWQEIDMSTQNCKIHAESLRSEWCCHDAVMMLAPLPCQSWHPLLPVSKLHPCVASRTSTLSCDTIAPVIFCNIHARPLDYTTPVWKVSDLALAAAFALSFVTTMASASTQMMNDEISRSKYERTTLKRWRVITNWQPSSVSLCFKYNAYVQSEQRFRRIRYQLPILYSTAGRQLTGNSSYHHLQESTNTRPLRKYFWHAPSKTTQGANHGCQLAIPCQVHMQYQGNTVIWQEIDMSTQNCKIHAESLRSEWCCHDAVMMLAPLPCQSWHPLLPVSKLHPCVASRTSTLSCDTTAPVIFCNIHARPLDYTTPVWKVSDLALAAAFALSFVTTMASASTQMMNDEISRSKYERTTLKRWRVITNWQPSSVSLCFKYNAYVQSEQRFRRIRYQLPILYSTAGSQLTGNSSYHHLQESTNTRPLRKYFWHAPSKSTQGANHGCQLAIPCQVHMQYQGNTVIWQEIDMSTQNCKIHAESLRSEWCCHDAVMMLAPLPCQSWHPLLPVSKLHPCVASRTSTLSCDIIAPVIFCNIHARPLDYTTPVWKVSDLALAAAFALSFVTTMASASTQMMNDEISRSKYERTTLKRWRVITNWQPSSVSLCFKYNAYVQSEQRFRRIRYQLPILYSTAGSQLTGNSSYHHLQESTNTRPLRKYFWHAPSKTTQGANHGCQLAIPCQVHMQYQGNTVIWQEIDMSTQNCKIHAESLRSEWCCHDAVMMLAPLPCQSWHPLLPVSKLHPCVASRTSTLSCDIIAPVIFCNIHARPLDSTTPVWKVSDLALAAAFALSFVTTMASASTQMMNDEISRSKYERTTLKRWRVITNWQPSSVSLCFKYNAYVQSEQRFRRIRYQLPILYSTAGSQLTGNSSYHHLQESTNTRPLRKYLWHAPSKSTQGANHGCQLAIPCQVHMQYQGNTVIWQEIDMSTQNCRIHAESLRSEWCCHDAVMMLAPLPCQSWHPLLPVSKLHPCVASRTSTLSCDIIAPVIFCNIHARPLDSTTPVWKVSDLALAAAFALSFVTTMASASTQMMNDEISRSKYERTTLKRWRVITNWQPSSLSLCFKYNAECICPFWAEVPQDQISASDLVLYSWKSVDG